MTTSTHELRIERIFDAPRELVWKTWTTPELIMQWWGPEYFTSPICKVDLRVGGKYLFCMRGPDGTDYWSGGTYNEIVPFEKLVCTDAFANEKGEQIDPASFGFDPNFPKENVVTITFEDMGDKTKLTVLYVVESEAILEIMRKVQMKEGWETSLNKFGRVLAGQLHKSVEG